ncbi:MAG: NADH-quinone oxidoreductase subunit C [Planctomycetaceae bacterium]|jgi:NADH-quinone oxidoreductase subunit C|nr:NADH-quinone oxidoreductase subunit C [Planctomycetaceae bacterium]
MSETKSLKESLESKLTGIPLSWSEFRSQQRVTVPASNIAVALKALRDAGMDQLIDITAVDMLEYPGATDRFEVVYLLLNTNSGERLTVKTHVNEPELKLPSACPIWFGADWLEREVYDMFGIVFDGHPNFKRLLLPDAFESFPLRKDYPVKGRGERHNFPIITRAES